MGKGTNFIGQPLLTQLLKSLDRDKILHHFYNLVAKIMIFCELTNEFMIFTKKSINFSRLCPALALHFPIGINFNLHCIPTFDFLFNVDTSDEGCQEVTISYSSEQPVRVTALLANTQGYVYRRAEQTDGSAVTLSYSGLPRNQYILHINAGNEQFAEKFNVK